MDIKGGVADSRGIEALAQVSRGGGAHPVPDAAGNVAAEDKEKAVLSRAGLRVPAGGQSRGLPAGQWRWVGGWKQCKEFHRFLVEAASQHVREAQRLCFTS